MYPSKAKGFTLVELMTVVAIIAILLVIALPSFQSSLRSNRVATTANELMASVALARSEAIRSRDRGVICTSTNGETCDGDWNSGWMVWSDVDNSGTVNGTETVVRYVQGKPQLLMAGSVTRMAFDGRGRVVSGGQAVSVRPADAAEPLRCVVIGPTGQTRITQGACPS